MADFRSTGDEGLSGAQWTISLAGTTFVTGMKNFMMGSPSWLVVMTKSAREMCFVWSYLEIAGTVNSPRRAMEKKVDVIQANMAASQGSARSMAA